jgi:hypothetical protein
VISSTHPNSHHVAEGALGGDAHHEADDAGGRQNAGADLAKGLVLHQQEGERQHNNHRRHDAPQNAHLGDNLACLQVVGRIRRVVVANGVLSGLEKRQKPPGDRPDEHDSEPPAEDEEEGFWQGLLDGR